MKAIADNDFMRNLEPVQINEIVECMYEREFKKEQFVIREGGVGTQLFVLSGADIYIFMYVYVYVYMYDDVFCCYYMLLQTSPEPYTTINVYICLGWANTVSPPCFVLHGYLNSANEVALVHNVVQL